MHNCFSFINWRLPNLVAFRRIVILSLVTLPVLLSSSYQRVVNSKGFDLTTSAPPVYGAAQARTIGTTTVNPNSTPAGVPLVVTVVSSIADPAVVADSVNLQRLDSSGRVVSVIGTMHDDGLNGDATAGDKLFSISTTIFENTPGTVTLRVSAAFQGSLLRAFSAPVTVNITGSAIGITIISPSNAAYLNTSPVTVSGTVGDSAASVTVNGVIAPVSGNNFVATVPLNEGPNTLTAVAANTNGTASTASSLVTLDTTPPRVEIYAPANNSTTGEATATVTGLVNDIVVGTVNPQQATVTVNGVPAQVINRTFTANVPLAMGANAIQATGVDRAGNGATATINITRGALSEATLRIHSGNGQSGQIRSLLPAPLVAQLINASGQPVANTPVVFRVTNQDGTLSPNGNPGTGLSSIVINTDAQGLAPIRFTLGSRAGAGSNIIEASTAGVVSTAVFTASATPAAPGLIIVDSGNNQSGVINQQLPLPFIAIVTDTGYNRLAGVRVTFTVKGGGGNFAGQPNFVTTSDSDGRVMATLTLGSDPGVSNNLVEATFTGNTGLPVAFAASGLTPGPAIDTKISGVVLDNSNNPIPGVTMRLFQVNQGNSGNVPQEVAQSVSTNQQGQFVIQPAPVGVFKLMVDGGTAERPGDWPTIEYDIVTVAGQNNTVGSPIYLPELLSSNRLCVSPTTGGTLTIPQAPGFSLTIAPGSAVFPGGSRTGCVSVTPVNMDKVPMVPGFGQQPRFVVTIQPVGTAFSIPAAISIPNLDGLPPRAVTEMYSFDHDLASFVAIGSGTVSEDGSVIRSDPGVGVLKAGWHCGGNPNQAGSAGSLNLTVSPTEARKAVGDKFSITAMGVPPLDAVYSWEVIATQPGDDASMVILTNAPTCPSQSTCKASLEVKKVGTATVRVHFKCTTTGLEVTKDVRVTAAEIKFLDRNDNVLDPALAALKVSKFVTNQDFTTNDPDNFKVEVTDGSVAGNTVKVDLASNGGALDSLNNVTLTKTPGTNKFRSDLLRLVADSVDKNAEPTRTLITEAGSPVAASYAGPPAGKAEINVCKPSDIKTVTISVTILRNKKKADGGTEVISETSVSNDLKGANQQYAQICVKISASISIADPPTGVDLSDGLTEFSSPSTPTTEEKALLDGLATASTADIQMFFVNSLSMGSRGEAFVPSSLTGGNAKYGNNVILSTSRTPFSLAHELGHLLLNTVNHESTSTNLMRSGTSATNAVDASKRLTTGQETTIRSHALVK